MKKYVHIKEWERWVIYTLLWENRSEYYIAKYLKRNVSSIWREIKRNSVDWVYMPVYAQREYEKRRSKINIWRRKLQKGSKLVVMIRKRMEEDKWSPDSIVWRIKLDWWEIVCKKTIYTYIYEQEPSLREYLTYKKWYKKRWRVEKRWKQKEWFKNISQRDPKIEERERIGDIEVDMVVSSWSNRKWWIVTLVDRKSRYVAAEAVAQKQSDLVWDILIRLCNSVRKEKLHTITADNGKEFYDFLRVESETSALFYFADPYASYQRGTNEQTNWMIRKFFPKWTDFSQVSNEELQRVISIINYKPRKSLWYLSAHEIFHWISR